jgi:5-(carboxyamino)imidazole ribonucleotide synthase
MVTQLGQCDVITLDLEAVSIEGMKRLEEKGVLTAPHSSVLEIIQNKFLQKEFFKRNNIPTSSYQLLEELDKDTPHGFLKAPTGGYDGKGVCAWKGNFQDIAEVFKKNVLWEEAVEIEKELSVIVVRGFSGETKTYLPTEMVFDPELNLISYTLYPAQVDRRIQDQAMSLAQEIAEKIDMVGVLAVEMFIDKKGDLLINELAPRPHNSGHHTIESCRSSQFENHLRAVLGLPLGSVDRKRSSDFSLTFNIIGEGEGEAQWLGVGEALAEDQLYIHNYGKKECREGRKMGHITLIDSSLENLIKRYEWNKNKIRVQGMKK